jgi:DSF synthase
MSHLHTVPSTLQADANDFTQLTTYLDTHNGIAWGYMHAQPRACFTKQLLHELLTWGRSITQEIDRGEHSVDYLVCASSVEGVFNLGGDLDLFVQLIEKQDRESLLKYAITCVDASYTVATHLHRPQLTTIALIQGDALGGGFESALAANVLVAERGCKMGLPEILFNLFPGMGALTFLGRRVGHHLAEKIILSGKLYLAEELHEMGVVDVLAEPGEGEQAIYEYIRRANRARNGALAVRASREISQPVRYDELKQITEIWVDAALRLGDKDLRMMQRLIARQSDRSGPNPSRPADAVLAV